jgi:hypothetical protein
MGWRGGTSEEREHMDQQQQQRINEAAEQFTDALLQSYKAVAERGVSVQEGSAKVTEVFFNQTIDNLRAQAEENRQTSQQLADQQQRRQEAGKQIAQESVGAYMAFMDSMFSYWQGGIQTAERSIEEPTRTVEARPEESSTRSSTGDDLPIGDYDSLNVENVTSKLEGLSVEEMRRVRDYEAQNKNRSTMLKEIDEQIRAGQPTS